MKAKVIEWQGFLVARYSTCSLPWSLDISTLIELSLISSTAGFNEVLPARSYGKYGELTLTKYYYQGMHSPMTRETMRI